MKETRIERSKQKKVAKCNKMKRIMQQLDLKGGGTKKRKTDG